MKRFEFRCTRNAPYTEPGCPGHTALKARQGHYIVAYSHEEALRVMAERFPDEVESGFTADIFKG